MTRCGTDRIALREDQAMNDRLGEEPALGQRLFVISQYLTIEDKLDKLRLQLSVELSSIKNHSVEQTLSTAKCNFTDLLKLPRLSFK